MNEDHPIPPKEDKDDDDNNNKDLSSSLSLSVQSPSSTPSQRSNHDESKATQLLHHQLQEEQGQEQGQEQEQAESIWERYHRGIHMVDNNPSQALLVLEQVSKEIRQMALFSTNEIMEDISTKSIPFLSLDHYLAMAHINYPFTTMTSTSTTPTNKYATTTATTTTAMQERYQHVQMSCQLWSSLFHQWERLEWLDGEERNEIQQLEENGDNDNDEEEEKDKNNNHIGSTSSSTHRRALLPTPSRDAKIARFKVKQELQKKIQYFQSLQQRRQRLQIVETDELDGYDEEGLQRTLALMELQLIKKEALEQWWSAKRELPMIRHMIQQEQERGSHHHSQHHHQQQQQPSDARAPPPLSNKPLQLTHITKNAVDGKLQIKREEIKSQVFRPGWNQPTMTLEELGEREYRQALEREARQKQAEAERSKEPRRYEELVRDGLEDNLDLVDASAKLDRDWDDWKDENPRGSGNKYANRGDKNF